MHCTVNVNEQECEKQKGAEGREGCLGHAKVSRPTLRCLCRRTEEEDEIEAAGRVA